MTELGISLFHRFHVRSGSKPVPFSTSKAQELFAYLVLFRDKAHSREFLAEALWQDAPPERSKAYLRKALWQLKHALADRAGREAPFLLIDDRWIRFCPDADVEIDIAAFEESYGAVEGVAGKSFTPEQAKLAQSAVDLYNGDLLESWYHDWCFHERQRFRFMYLSMLDKLVAHARANGEYDVAIGYGRRILRHEPSHERTHRQLMTLFHLSGDRNAALDQYHQCVRALRDDLDVEPDPRTVELFRQVSGHYAPAPLDDAERASGKHSPELAALLRRLENHRESLAAMYSRIDHDIRLINEIVGEHSRLELGTPVPALPQLVEPHYQEGYAFAD